MSKPRTKAVPPDLAVSHQAQPEQPGELQPLFEGESPPPDNQPGALAPPPEIDSQDFETSFGEPLDQTLDLDTWNDGKDLKQCKRQAKPVPLIQNNPLRQGYAPGRRRVVNRVDAPKESRESRCESLALLGRRAVGGGC